MGFVARYSFSASVRIPFASARLALHPAQFWETKNRPLDRDGVTMNRGATLIRRPLARNGLCWTWKGDEAKSRLASPSMSRTMVTASIPAQAYGVRSRSFAAALSVGGSRVHSAPSPTPVLSACPALWRSRVGAYYSRSQPVITQYSERGARGVKPWDEDRNSQKSTFGKRGGELR